MARVWIKQIDGGRVLRPPASALTPEILATADLIDELLKAEMETVLAAVARDSDAQLNVVRKKWLFGHMIRERVLPIAISHGVEPHWIYRAAYSYAAPYLEISARADRLGSDEISLSALLAVTPWDDLPGKNMRWADWWSILEAPNLRRDVRLINLVAKTIEQSGVRDARAMITTIRKHFRNWDTTHLTDQQLQEAVDSIGAKG